jgi:sterol desaturase/sphingolipid hydroxylase (fatty acid hydroxylase superfamily)
VLDPTVVAIPFYFGSMEAERRYLLARQEREDTQHPEEPPSPAVYTKDDAVASLTMGTVSLFAPLLSMAVGRYLTPGKGRFPKVLLGTVAGAVVATTVADRLARHDDPDDPEPQPTDDAATRRRRTVRRWAKQVSKVGGPVAIGAGTLAVSTTIAQRLSPKALWEKRGKHHDKGGSAVPWVAALLGWDFIYYWNHRMMHEVRMGWALHVVHHSSEHYNLSTALRQPVADVLGLNVPYGLLSYAGLRPELVEQARGWNLLYQYWIHTDAIRRIGKGEEVLNTPSHHRVHHGSNRKYLDRNHGSILITWDRLFGTFQREEEPVVYGLTKNIDTYNPLRIATHEYRDIVVDVARSTTWKDRLSYAFRGPGWAYERREQQVVAEQPLLGDAVEVELAVEQAVPEGAGRS